MAFRLQCDRIDGILDFIRFFKYRLLCGVPPFVRVLNIFLRFFSKKFQFFAQTLVQPLIIFKVKGTIFSKQDCFYSLPLGWLTPQNIADPAIIIWYAAAHLPSRCKQPNVSALLFKGVIKNLMAVQPVCRIKRKIRTTLRHYDLTLVTCSGNASRLE